MGTKMLGALGALGEADSEGAATSFAETLADPIGTLYRFSLPTSLLKRRWVEEKETVS
jgi:hypothetical protein